jgi:hypothetical protein
MKYKHPQTKSAEYKLSDDDILNLPDAPEFISKPPAYTVNEMIKICEAMLPYWNKQRENMPEPPLMKEPFVLYDEPTK